MAMFAWVMMGLALWHFAIFIPDRFWGGIVGAFLGALFGAALFGLLVNGFTIPGQNDTHILQAHRGRTRRHHRHGRGVLRGRAPQDPRAGRLSRRRRRRFAAPARRRTRRVRQRRPPFRRAALTSLPGDAHAATRCPAVRQRCGAGAGARSGHVASRSRRCSCAAGITDLDAARAWLAAADEHPASAFEGIDEAIAVLLRHARAGTRVTVHGDYDVDGVTSTAILVRALRAVGADVDWYLPSRSEDGYGLSAATVEQLAARGTKLLVTTDCGITAVDEVALARSLGLDVVVTDHHSPRADGALPDAPIVHPAVCGYPCPDLCAGGVAHKVAGALLEAAGHDAAIALADLDLVALATVADCVPLRGENRRLVRQGLQALGRTEKVGLRALMRVAKVDPTQVDARALGFGLAPRINAAGRLHRADAALELLLTHDEDARRRDRPGARPRQRRPALRRAADRCSRPRPRSPSSGDQPAYVLWADGWHPGVIGIVASRIAERHHRPVVLIALREGEAEGDRLGPLDPGLRPARRAGRVRRAPAAPRRPPRGGGCTVARGELEALRAAFARTPRRSLTPERPRAGRARRRGRLRRRARAPTLAEELGRLAPFGIGNPSVSLLVPAARLSDARRWGRASTCASPCEAGGVRARAVAFGLTRCPTAPPTGASRDLHARAQRVQRRGRAAAGAAQLLPAGPAPELVGEPSPAAAWRDGLAAARARGGGVLGAAPARSARRGGAGVATRGRPPSTTTAAAPAAAGVGHGPGARVRDRRGGGLAGTIGALVATGEPVLVVCADAPARARQLDRPPRRLCDLQLGRAASAIPRSPTGTPTSSRSTRPRIPTRRRSCARRRVPDGPSGVGRA